MNIIIKFSPEIIIKSKSVRIFFIKVLVKNIQIILKKHNILVAVVRYWDYLEIKCEDSSYLKISKVLVNVPGIHHFLYVQDSTVFSLEDIYHQIMLANCCSRLSGKTFCVRVKRYGNHIVTSQDIERYLGNKINCVIQNVRVNLINPDKIIYLEIKNNRLFIIVKRYKGLGGFPIGTQRECLSLVSGGFDSVVSSYMLIRRGCKVHYCFFNLIGDINHTIEVYKIVYYLWKKFSYSHNVKFICVNFSHVVKELFVKIQPNYVGIVLKRLMIQAASSIATCRNIQVLSTGEVLGQVSSQTLDNLILINNMVSFNCMILRPLIAYDKESIIELSRKIGTEALSRTIPEFCGMIVKKSSTKVSKKHIEWEESFLNSLIFQKTIDQAHIINVYDISKFISNQRSCFFDIETKTKLDSQDIILDIRTDYEQKKNPIHVPCNVQVQKIPFYNLIECFPNLDQSKVYVLYCDYGVMSRLQAVHLYQQGFRNVKVYRLISN
ncbi:thiamine biosynthesis protein ThiI [Candidatus Blochmanniella floridana]|uniref:tRNA sulfurtransferase n=1 Tax=Blochmanniella floridana TaxID=203907 RepID=Q7VRH8_BLOFL|nr:thiamine biosynthesis protein ThiI [Candidatus Blochmannia floridanus]